MFSHIVIFWTKPDVENAEQRLIDGLLVEVQTKFLTASGTYRRR